MSLWSSAVLSTLPDSSFAWIDSNKNRHLPYKDASGKVDHAHVVDALARMDQVNGLSGAEADSVRTKLQNALKQTHSAELGVELSASDASMLSSTAISAGANGELPNRFPLLTTFDLPNSNRGHFTVTKQDLEQIKEKFDAQIGFPSSDAGTGLMLDFDHQANRKDAAAWIHALEVVSDPTDDKKATLFADQTEWTPEGEAAVRGGSYKMVSPTGAFGRKDGKLSSYSWHTDLKNKISNALFGAALTNEPFQSMMSPIRLSANGEKLDSDDTAYDKVMFVYDEQKNKEQSMNFEQLRTQERDKLSVPELDFLAEHKDELSAPERTKFKLEASSEEVVVSEEDKQTLAAIKDGSKKIVDAGTQTADKEQLDRMESTIERYRKQEVTDLLDKHVKRGAIKQDAAKLDGYWGKQLLNAGSDTELQAVKDALDGLSSNDQLAKEIGTGEDVNAGTSAREQLDALAQKRVLDAAKDGKVLTYSQALKAVYKENNDLRTQDKQELTKVGA